MTVRVRQPSVSHDAISAEQLALNLSAKEFLADRPPASTGLLRRAAETDRGVATLLSVHPRSVDGAILLVHLRG